LTDARYLDALRQTARGYWEEIKNGQGSPKLRAKLSAIEEEIEEVLCS
jgi:ribosomal protein S12 methylthiotransferase accessory factor YcaO